MTAVFACDLRKFKGNPFHQDTPFGRPITACIGDALEADLAPTPQDARVTALVEALKMADQAIMENTTDQDLLMWSETIVSHIRAALAAFDKDATP